MLPRDIAPTRRSHARHCRRYLAAGEPCVASSSGAALTAALPKHNSAGRCSAAPIGASAGPRAGGAAGANPTLPNRIGWVPSGIPTSAGCQVGFPLTTVGPAAGVGDARRAAPRRLLATRLFACVRRGADWRQRRKHRCRSNRRQRRDLQPAGCVAAVPDRSMKRRAMCDGPLCYARPRWMATA